MSEIRRLENHFDAAPDAARVMAHARLLIKVGRLYEAVVPGTLARISRVANIKSGIVVIHADTGAAAAKIRQIAGRLTDGLLKRGVECSGIEVRVQPPGNAPPRPIKSQRTLSPKAISSIENMLNELPRNSGLSAALEELLKRSVRRTGD